MSEFKRGIVNQNFITELNSNKYWQQMVKDDDLFIAIRNECLSVYYYGQSICKVEFIKNRIKWTTHKKYLGVDESSYADTGVYLEKIDELKKNARKHGGKEKEQIKRHILEDKKLCILDVEITFGREEGYSQLLISLLYLTASFQILPIPLKKNLILLAISISSSPPNNIHPHYRFFTHCTRHFF